MRVARPGRATGAPTTPLPGPRSARRRATLAVAAVTVAAGAVLAVTAPPTPPALAAVSHGEGYQATVLGWTSWYGAYHLGDLGTGWCIDHGLRAPDADFGYVPTDVADVPGWVRTAIGWAASRPVEGRVDAAARMLVFHDLMGATYPFGRLDVDALGLHQLAGFGGDEAAVLGRARSLKADALAHAGMVAPLRLAVAITEVPPGAAGIVEVRVLDAAGAGVGGVAVSAGMTGGALDGSTGTTDGAGVVWFGFRAGQGEIVATADAVVPSSTLSAWASSTVPAQRIVRPDTTAVHGEARYAALPPTTTTTAPPTTTTTAPPPTTTTAPPMSMPPTTAAPPTLPPARPPATPTLPRTGPSRSTGVALVGVGLVLAGAAVRGEARRRTPTPVPRRP